MKIRLLLFAGLREKMGSGEIGLELPLRAKISDIQEKLYPNGEGDEVWRSLAFALNQSYVSAGEELKEGDEVALIPPVAGG